ncbi:MAG: aminotransferase class V-fold PLP-dependent enzyme, partial [Actinomycetia bacterium]|nr:aminotransferase class V-fold PLP-dependent enzyme [Actinomycetes bacterium]
VKKGRGICPLITGGHHERGKRAGTENNYGIIGLGKAAEIVRNTLVNEKKKIFNMKMRLKKGLEDRVPELIFNGDSENGLPGTLNVSFKYIEGESILLYLDMEGICVSTGSACSTGSLDPSHVLLATGMEIEYAHGSIRFSLSSFNSDEDVDYVLEKLPPIIQRLRDMSPLYTK